MLYVTDNTDKILQKQVLQVVILNKCDIL